MTTLYGHPQSPFCRSVSILLELLDVKHEYKLVDLFQGEHLKPEYKKLNPQHNVPYFVDEKGLALNESRAILVFLAQKYDKSKKFFPDCIETQAKIHQRLYFDATVLWPAFREIFFPIAFQQKKKDEVPEDKFTRLKEVLGWLNEFVTPTGYLAGTDHMTVADIAAYAVYATAKKTQKTLVDFDDYPEANKWEANIQGQIKNFDKVMGDGLQRFETFFRTKTGLI